VSEPAAAIDVSWRCGRWDHILPDAQRLACATARLAIARGMSEAGIVPPEPAELGIVLVDDFEQRRLNRDWRGIDRPTNVLAFPAWDPGTPVPSGAPLLLGDIVLAFETVAREAERQAKPLADHFRHLIVHGVLHLLGYDHAAEDEAAVMETLESSILADLGVADPYRATM
jgi:probable rRNA maturation factor